MRFTFLLLSSVFLLFSDAFPVDHRLASVGKITIDNGLPHSDANALLRDEKGIVWIGTYSGLARYDGYEVKRYYCVLDPSTQAYDNRIADMCLHDGKIWMATDGGVQCFDIRSARYLPVQSPENAEPLYSISCGPDGTLYAITVNNRLRIFRSSESGSLVPVPLDIPGDIRFYHVAGTGQNEWLASSDQGLWRIHPGEGKPEPFATFDQTGNQLTGIRYIGFDNDKTLLLCDDSGFYRSDRPFDPSATEIHTTGIRLKNARSQVSGVLRLPDQTYCISSHGGIALYTPGEDSAEDIRYFDTSNHFPEIPSDYINDMLYDPSGVLFLASYGQGVSIVNLRQKLFHTLRQQKTPGLDLPENIVRAIVEDGSRLWIGTNSKGIVCYDMEQRRTIALDPDGGLKSRNIRALALEDSRYLWVASENGVDLVDLKRNVSQSRSAQFPSREVSSLAVDGYGQVWAGGWHDGLHCIRRKADGSFDVLSLSRPGQSGMPDFGSHRIYAVYAAPGEPLLYFSTEKKLFRIELDSKGDIRHICECRDKDDSENSTSHFICSIDRQDDTTLWVGTIGSGVKRLRFTGPAVYETDHFDETGGFPFRDVESVLVDRQGMVWCAGNGLVRLDPLSREVCLFNADDGLAGNSFKVGCHFRGTGNRLYFGGINGITYFNPDEIRLNDVLPLPLFSRLTVNNRDVEPTQAHGAILTGSLAYTDHIRLRYNQNHFALHFSAAHYVNPGKCRFRYMIEKTDPSWVYLPPGNRTASFSNLPYGTYTILLQAANNDEIWGERTARLTVTVSPPWWWTAWAKSLYILLALAIVFLILRYTFRSIRLNNRLRIKEIEEQKNEQLREFQSRFFTNISHELRTPITLILGEVEQLQEEKQPGSTARLDILNRNTRRLLSLVNELMDFRKIESEGMPLHIHPFDPDRFLEEIAAEFRSVAQLRHIDYRIQVPPAEAGKEGYFDPEVMEKIVLNILNNAFKYTQKGGSICLETFHGGGEWQPVYAHTYCIESPHPAEDLYWIRLIDTGIGISGESLPAIFDRYYQIHDTEHDPHLGSGVGLALVKSLVLLHRGTIRISSERKEGTEFMIGLPSLKEQASDSSGDTVKHEIPLRQHPDIPVFPDDTINPEEKEEREKTEPAKENARYTLLVAEDNEDLLTFLKEELKSRYRIVTARNGLQAWEKLMNTPPDLILSDWMMPELDGIRLCHRVKNDPRYAHIPLILLTAKDSVDSQVEGIASGADAYFSKPFSLKLLVRTIETLLRQREQIKSYVAGNYLTERVKSTRNQAQDKFMERFVAVVEEHMENPELNVDDICRLLSTSRTKLYKHVHAACQRSIMDMVRYLRLNKAIQWMAETEMPLQEIMLLVGIQSQSYFSRAFKAEFGLTPSRYIENVIRCRKPPVE